MKTFGSLFSGIGGFDLGFERAGMECAWQCEIDTAAQGILKRHFAKEIYNDVRSIGRNAGTVDVICGGFPCQDVSIAGKRAGLAGERSGLWFEFARVIDELEPGTVVIENVPGLLSSNGGRDFAVIIQWLVQRGYGVCWRVFDAQYFGVPQRRRRVFIVGSFGSGRSAEILFEREGMFRNTPTRSKAEEDVANTFTIRSGKEGGGKGYLEQASSAMTLGGQQQYLDIARSLTSRNERINAETETFVINLANSGANQNNVKQTDIADTVDTWGTQAVGTLAASGNGKTQQKNELDFLIPSSQTMGVRRLTPVECERLQGFPDGWTDGQSDSARYKQLGNAVAVPVAEWLGRRIAALPVEAQR
jgi:DNA (cytosine-5)-methyltransferase 1